MKLIHIAHKLSRLHKAESGSAMTEFVIGLPIFILIFSGMGSLYSLNNSALLVRAEANSDLWRNAEMGAGDIIPVAAIGSVGSFGDIVQNGASALGIYADSGVKTVIPLNLVPGSKPQSPCFTVGCALGGANSDYFSWGLLNDNAADGLMNGNISASGWANVISSALTVTGSRPAFAAGIRYGAVEGNAATKTVSIGQWGSFDLQPGKLDIPGITQPTHRALAVGLTRLEFAREDFWNEQVPEFNSDFNFDSSSRDGADECSTAIDGYNQCMQSGPVGESPGDAQERCEGQAPGGACDGIGGSNPLGSIGGGWCGGAVGCP